MKRYKNMGIIYLIIGALGALAGAYLSYIIKHVSGDAVLSFGITLAFVGVIFLVKYMRFSALSSEKKEEIENAYRDERNIYINSQARNIAFAVTVMAIAFALIIFYAFPAMTADVRIVLDILFVISIGSYLISYFIIRRSH